MTQPHPVGALQHTHKTDKRPPSPATKSFSFFQDNFKLEKCAGFAARPHPV